MNRYTVKQLARHSGVSVRTLHHYDAIGLLKPAFVGSNGYRHYRREELLRLQQILLHREFGMSLREIAAVLDDPGFDRLAALRAHRARIDTEAQRYRLLIATIDRTITELEGEHPMNTNQAFQGFAPERQEKYEQWLIDRYGDNLRERLDDSKANFAALSETERHQLLNEYAELERDLAESCRRKLATDSPALAPLLTRHRAWMARMWNRPCPPEAYAGLADLYLQHPDFRARYEALAPGFTEYLAAAMKAQASGAAG